MTKSMKAELKRIAESGEVNGKSAYVIHRLISCGLSSDETNELFSKLQDAASAGSHLAQHFMGFAHMEHLIQPSDYSEARRWFERATANGFANSGLWLGVMLRSGLGGERDEDRALLFLREAAANGITDANIELADYYLHCDEIELAKVQLEEAASSGSSFAMIKLAKLLSQENTKFKDEVRALALIKSAAEMGNSGAYGLLAQIYGYGLLGEEKDKKLSEFYRTKSMEALADGPHTLIQ